MDAMKLHGIRALIFDFGGTLYDSSFQLVDTTRRFLDEVGLYQHRKLTDSEMLELFSNGPDKWLDEYMLKNDVDMHWKPSNKEWLEYGRRVLHSLGVTKNVDEIATEVQKKWDAIEEGMFANLIDGCKETLEELQNQGYKLSIASNRFDDPSRYFERDRISHLFEVVEYTNVPGYKKPAPYMLIVAAAKMGVNPINCAYVGNMVQFDVAAAKNADMMPILLTWIDKEQADNATPEIIVIDHIRELLQIVK